MKSLLTDIRGWIICFPQESELFSPRLLVAIRSAGCYQPAYCRLSSPSADSYFSHKPCGKGEMIHSQPQPLFFPCCSVSVHVQAFQFHEAALHESWNVIASSWVKWTISVPTMFLKNKITAFTLLHAFSASESLCWCKGIKYSQTPARPILYNSISVEKITFIIFVRGRNKT